MRGIWGLLILWKHIGMFDLVWGFFLIESAALGKNCYFCILLSMGYNKGVVLLGVGWWMLVVGCCC